MQQKMGMTEPVRAASGLQAPPKPVDLEHQTGLKAWAQDKCGTGLRERCPRRRIVCNSSGCERTVPATVSATI